MASALAIVFLVLGIACQFMLTLQKFSSGMMGIAFLAVSIALCAFTVWRHGTVPDRPKEPFVIAGLAALMIVVHAVQLPHNHELEQQYHRVIENARANEILQELRPKLDETAE